MYEEPKKTIADIQRSCLLLAGHLTAEQLGKLNEAEKIIYELQKDFEKDCEVNSEKS